MRRTLTAIPIVAWAALLSLPGSAIGQKSQPLSSSQVTSSGIDLVVRDPSGTTIPKARVIIADPQKEEIANGLTDRWGRFSVSQVPPGAYKLTIRLAGFQAQSSTLLVQENAVAELSVTLPVERSPERVSVPLPVEPIPDILRHGDLVLALVVKDESGAVIPKAWVTVIQQETGAKIEGRTSEVGVYNVPDLAPGQYIVAAKSTGFIAVKTKEHLSHIELEPITLTLPVAPSPCDPCSPIGLMVETKASSLGSELLPEPRPTPTPTSPPHQLQRNRFMSFFTSVGAKLGF